MIWHVFIAAALTDLATGLGAVPFWFVPTLTRRWQGIAYAVAGGMMISAAVFSLAEQGLGRGRPWRRSSGWSRELRSTGGPPDE